MTVTHIPKHQLDANYPFTTKQISYLLTLSQHVFSCLQNEDHYDDSHNNVDVILRSIPNNQSKRDALSWINQHLLSPFCAGKTPNNSDNNDIASTSTRTDDECKCCKDGTISTFLSKMIQCAIHHSHVFCNFENQTQDEETKQILLFLEAMSALCGRKGGPTFEIRVLFDFVLNFSHLQSDHNLVIKSRRTFDSDEKVCAKDLIGLFYRLALSCHVLQHWPIQHNNIDGDNDDKHSNEGNGTQSLLSNHDLDCIASLGSIAPQSMVLSLGMHKIAPTTASSSSSSSSPLFDYNHGSFNSPNDNNTDEESTMKVNYETFHNWVDINFPQLANILSTFIHLVFLNNENNMIGEDTDRDTDNLPTETMINDNIQDNSDDENEEKDTSTFYIYAQGHRKTFQFPQLEQLVLANSINKSSISRKIVASLPSSSDFFRDQNISSSTSSSVVGHFAFALASMDSNLCGKWSRMYSTETDGFAFLNMQRALTGYTGPTIMLVRPTQASSSDSNTPGLFGFYTTNPWKESNDFYGTSDCFLFRAEPRWNVYRPQCFVQGLNHDHKVVSSQHNNKGPNIQHPSLSSSRLSKRMNNYMYFHPSAGHMNNGGSSSSYGRYSYTSKSSKPRGLVIGGTTDQPRFYITESFEQCVASSGNMTDKSFANGPLLPGEWDKYYNVDIIEVWGVGGEHLVHEAVLAKDKHEDMADAVRKRVQKVDRKQFLDDFKSGFHGNKLFDHRLDGNKRHDFGVDADKTD